jgi:hypothetical protein
MESEPPHRDGIDFEITTTDGDFVLHATEVTTDGDGRTWICGTIVDSEIRGQVVGEEYEVLPREINGDLDPTDLVA